MIIHDAAKQDFDFAGDIAVDLGNEGFREEEIEKLANTGAMAKAGIKGETNWWKDVWRAHRSAPPALQKLKSEFGYQSAPLLTDLLAVAKAQKTPLEGMIKAGSASHNFYIMRCGVYIVPDGGEKFEALKFEVSYKDERVSTFGLLPGPQSDKLLELGGKADIGVNGKAEFGFPEISIAAASADASAKAKLESKFIISFHYELKTPVVDSFGVGTSFCRWLLHKGDDLRNDVLFYPIVMAPKTVTGFDCEFKAYFKIGHSDWRNAEFFLKPPRTIRVGA